MGNNVGLETKLGKAIGDFLEEKSKKSKDTAANYLSDIKQFLKYMFDKTIDTVIIDEIEQLNYNKLNDYLKALSEIKENSTINRKASAIESLYKYLKKMGNIEMDISFFGLITALPNRPKSYDVMPMQIAELYVEAASHEKHKPLEKKWAIILAIELGLRLSEVLDLKWSQFKVDGKSVIVAGYGKGNVKYVEVISKALYDDLTSELKEDGNKLLFTLSQKNVNDMMIRLKKVLKQEDRNYTFHSFKKASVTNTHKYTRNILDAQKKGKHKKIETTLIYLEEAEAKMTGYFSLSKNLNNNLYKEVDHELLITTLEKMPKDVLFLLNLELNDKEKDA